MSGSASKTVEKLLAGIECNGCNKIFASLFRYDQHRRSNALRGTACSAVPDENRRNLHAVIRPNMSTASLFSRPAHRTRGGAVNSTREKAQKHTFTVFDIKHISHISEYLSYFFYFKPGLTAAGRPGVEMQYYGFFSCFIFFDIKIRRVHIVCIFLAYL
jgi:hypothetical protein